MGRRLVNCLMQLFLSSDKSAQLVKRESVIPSLTGYLNALYFYFITIRSFLCESVMLSSTGHLNAILSLSAGKATGRHPNLKKQKIKCSIFLHFKSQNLITTRLNLFFISTEPSLWETVILFLFIGLDFQKLKT